MKIRNKVVLLTAFCVSSGLSILVGQPLMSKGFMSKTAIHSSPNKISNRPIIKSYASRKLMRGEDVILQSDIVLEGKVIHVTPSLWTTDQTDPTVSQWLNHSLYPFYQVTVQVSKPIFGARNGQQILVTIPGRSPIGPAPKLSHPEAIYMDKSADNLKLGDSGIFFITNNYPMGWMDKSGKSSTRKVTGMAGDVFYGFIPENGKNMYVPDQWYVSDQWKEPSHHSFESLRALVLAKKTAE